MINELLLAVLVGVHFIIMTVVGDLKDVGGRETSFAELYGEDSKEFASILAGFGTVQSLIMFYLMPNVILGVVFSVYVFIMLMHITFTDSEKQMKKGIVKYEILSVVALVFILSGFMEIVSLAAILVLTVVWGLSWQTMLYGDPLYFP